MMARADTQSLSPAARAQRHRRMRVFAWSLLVLLGLLFVLHVSLPALLKWGVNKRLAGIPEYGGRVEGVGVNLFRGAYTLHQVNIVKVNGEKREPFFAAKRIDFSLLWRELFRGKVVSDITAEEARVVFVKAATPESSQMEADKRWQDVIDDLFPIEIMHFEIKDSEVRFVDTTRTPRVDLVLRDLDVTATGLRNRPAEKDDPLPAHVVAHAEAMGGGKLSLSILAEPLAARPHFDLNVQLRGVNLPELNDFLRAYGNVDVAAGKFELYLEIAAKDGRYEGYVKPFMSDLDFRNLRDREKAVGARLWEGVVSLATKLLKNKSTEEVATRVPFAGEFDDTRVGVWETVVNLLRHGFVRALTQGLEGSVEPEDVDKAVQRDPAAKAPEQKLLQDAAKEQKEPSPGPKLNRRKF